MPSAVGTMSTSSSYSTIPKDPKAEAENQWSAVLNEVRATASNRLVEKNLVILGDHECGKSLLLANIIGKDSMAPTGVGLEHVCIPVKDDDREDSTQVNAWILEEEEYGPSLLPLVFNEKTLEKTIVWITVSMTKPWSMLESLNKWTQILSTIIDRMKIDPAVMKQYYAKVEKLFKDYVDPTVAKLGPVSGEKEVDLPLGENTLTENLGVPIVVVVTKADYMSVLEKDMDYKEEKFDFLQMHLRTWCLKHGAALIFTSAKEGKNTKNLHRYMAHLLYGLKFEEEGFVLDRDTVFIPLGWDNEKKISILNDSLREIRPDDSLETIITAPPPLVRQNAADAGLQAEDDQEFVKRIQAVLQQPIPSRNDSPASVQKTVGRASPSSQTTPKKGDGPRGSLGAGGANESALSTFFNTLLNKNNKTPPSAASTGIPRTASPATTSPFPEYRMEAAAELDRIARGEQAPVQEVPPEVQEENSESTA